MGNFKSYMEAKEMLQSIINSIPFMWAFSDSQFKECARKHGYEDTDEFASVCCKGPGGSFLLKSDMNKVIAAYKRLDEIHAEIEADDELLYEMLKYEMGNHECQISMDYGCILDLVSPELRDNPRFLRIFQQARRDFIQYCDEHDYY